MDIPALNPGDARQDYISQSYVFALALNHLTGLPIVEMGCRLPDGRFVGSHAALELPDGRLLDADGSHDADRLCAAYEALDRARIEPFLIIGAIDDEEGSIPVLDDSNLQDVREAQDTILDDVDFTTALRGALRPSPRLQR